MREEKENVVEIEKPELSVNSIRNLLWDEIHELRTGHTSAANLSALTNATGKILSTVVLQIKLAEMTGQKPDLEMISFITNQTKAIEHKE